MLKPELGHLHEFPRFYRTTPAGKLAGCSVLPPPLLRTIPALYPYFYVNACPCGVPYFYGLRSFLFYARLGVLAFVVRDP
jgi:hypothetical protein